MASLLERLIQAKKMREGGRKQREERFLADVPEDFTGPTQPSTTSTPEEAQALALKRAEFLQQELTNFERPDPEATGVSKFARSGFGRFIQHAYAPGAYKLNRRALAGTGELKDVTRDYEGALEQAKIAGAQGELATNERVKGILREATRPGQSAETLSTRLPVAVARAAAEKGDVAGVSAGVEDIGQGARNVAFLQQQKREEKARSSFSSAFGELVAQGKLGDPRSMLALQAHLAAETGDAGAMGEIATRFSNVGENEEQSRERALRMQIMQKQLDDMIAGGKGEKARQIMADTTDIFKLMPAGSDIEDAAEASLALHADASEDVKANFGEAFARLKGPLQEAAKAEKAIKAAKNLDDARDQFIKERSRFFDAKDDPVGWLAQTIPGTSQRRADALTSFKKPDGSSYYTYEEYFREFFDKRGKALFTGEDAGGAVGARMPGADVQNKLRQSQGLEPLPMTPGGGPVGSLSPVEGDSTDDLPAE